MYARRARNLDGRFFFQSPLIVVLRMKYTRTNTLLPLRHAAIFLLLEQGLHGSVRAQVARARASRLRCASLLEDQGSLL